MPISYYRGLVENLEQSCFLNVVQVKKRFAPTDYDKVEDIHNTLYKKEKLTSQTDIREDPDEYEEVTWQMLSLLQDRLCLYVYTITIISLIIFFRYGRMKGKSVQHDYHLASAKYFHITYVQYLAVMSSKCVISLSQLHNQINGCGFSTFL